MPMLGFPGILTLAFLRDDLDRTHCADGAFVKGV